MTNTPSERAKRKNQIIFIEYSKLNDDMHHMTVVDSYRNILGRIYKEENAKNRYELKDHYGKTKLTNATLQKIKSLFLKHEEEILSNAHKRRIASKKDKNQTAIPVE